MIKNNLITGNGLVSFGDGTGIYLFNPGPETEIYNNTIVESYQGIYTYGASGLQIKNCIIWGNDYALTTNNGTIFITYCCIDNCDIIGDPQITHNMCSDPLLGNDYHISFNSLCKDAGAPDNYTGQTDMDGQDRVYNGSVDIGADEYWP